MPAIYAQHGLRQNAPAIAAREPERTPSRGRVVSDRMKRLAVLWADQSKTGHDIAMELGFPSENAVHQAVRYYNLPNRPIRPQSKLKGA